MRKNIEKNFFFFLNFFNQVFYQILKIYLPLESEWIEIILIKKKNFFHIFLHFVLSEVQNGVYSVSDPENKT